MTEIQIQPTESLTYDGIHVSHLEIPPSGHLQEFRAQGRLASAPVTFHGVRDMQGYQAPAAFTQEAFRASALLQATAPRTAAALSVVLHTPPHLTPAAPSAAAARTPTHAPTRSH